LDDCDRVDVVVRVHRPIQPPACEGAITSLAFMFDEVPEPVWNVSNGELVVVNAFGHAAGGRDDRVGEVPVQHPKVRVDLGRGGHDLGQPVDVARVEALGRRSGSSPPPAGSAPATVRRPGTAPHHRVAFPP
jgi:hypothetical protein